MKSVVVITERTYYSNKETLSGVEGIVVVITERTYYSNCI